MDEVIKFDMPEQPYKKPNYSAEEQYELDSYAKAMMAIARGRKIDEILAAIIYCKTKIEEINLLRIDGKFRYTQDRLNYYKYTTCLSTLERGVKRIEQQRLRNKERAENLRHQNAIVREKSRNRALNTAFNLTFKQGMQTATQNLVHSVKYKEEKEAEILKEKKIALRHNPDFLKALADMKHSEVNPAESSVEFCFAGVDKIEEIAKGKPVEKDKAKEKKPEPITIDDDFNAIHGIALGTPIHVAVEMLKLKEEARKNPNLVEQLNSVLKKK